MRFQKFILMPLLLMGCATSSGVMQTSKDSYLITSDKGALSGLQASAMKTAREYCADQNKVMMVTGTQGQPSGAFTSSHFELQFQCLDKDDPRYKPGTIVPVAPTTADKLNH